MTGGVFDVLFWVLGIGWMLFSLIAWRCIGRIAVLPEDGAPAGATDSLPRVSVIIPARDEEERLEQTVLQLLAQTGISLELLLVDDRSSDRTPEILATLARQDSRIKVLTIRELPEGWLGKPYACHIASEQASGDWILFTDADSWMNPDVIRRAVRAAACENAEHVTLVPGEGHTTLAAQAILALLHVFASISFFRVNRDKKNAFGGAGAFNLVKHSAYRAIDGHQPLKMEVIDDVGLGKLLNKAGFRTRLYNASRQMEVVWCADILTLIRVLEKNMFSLFRFSYVQALCALVLYSALWLIPVAGVFSGTSSGVFAFAGLASIVIPAMRVTPIINVNTAAALLCVLLYPALALALINSIFKTWRQGGVFWRDTFHPLKDLRQGLCTRSWLE